LDDASKHQGCWQEHFEMREIIAHRVVGGAVGFLESHQEDYEGSGTDEEDLHHGVVDRNEVHKQVHVTHQEHNQVDFLSFAGEA